MSPLQNNSNNFSVALCTYNGARYLEEQLESIVAQTRPPDEIVICDDASTDGTIDLLTRFAARSAIPVQVVVNSENLGSTRNFEKAIRLCKGNLIALSDQDDVWLPQKLEVFDALFQQRPSVGIVFSDAEIVDENLLPCGATLWEKLGFDRDMRQFISRGQALRVLLPGWLVTGATMAFRTAYRDLALNIPANLPMIHDGWIALVIAAVAEVAPIEEPLIKYRQHSLQQIGAPERKLPARLHAFGSVAGLSASVRRTNSYEQLIEIGELLRQTLQSKCDQFDCTDALSQLEERLGHLRTRSKMPGSVITRLPRILRELVAGRYHRYANGFFSAAKDLLPTNQKN